MEPATAKIESLRCSLQAELDKQKSPSQRNCMGQFATPIELAMDIQRYAKSHFGESEEVRFIDPAIGTGSFFSALLQTFPPSRINSATGFEVDPHYGVPTAKLWSSSKLIVHLKDFTRAITPKKREKFNLLICNPPYVRHHHIPKDEKQRLNFRAWNTCGEKINGLAGLYCYFLALSHPWMSEGGLAGWLIPSEFMDVNYGVAIKRYLLKKVTLMHIHRFDPTDLQFGDALVSSVVVWFLNHPPGTGHRVRFSLGGTLECPKEECTVPIEALQPDAKWTHFPGDGSGQVNTGPVLGDLFKIRRGVATGGNKYFILSEDEIESRGLTMKAFRPILPNPRHMQNGEIRSDRLGNPILDRRLFLLDPQWTENEIEARYPQLWSYLEEGKELGIANRYICRHRTPWYRQEKRPPAPFVCTYLGRSDGKTRNPFRFFLNNTNATAANAYLMLYPNESTTLCLQMRPELKRRVWMLLNQISPDAMLKEGRVYGGGLFKMEPRELGSVPARPIADLLFQSGTLTMNVG